MYWTKLKYTEMLVSVISTWFLIRFIQNSFHSGRCINSCLLVLVTLEFLLINLFLFIIWFASVNFLPLFFVMMMNTLLFFDFMQKNLLFILGLGLGSVWVVYIWKKAYHMDWKWAKDNNYSHIQQIRQHQYSEDNNAIWIAMRWVFIW